MALWDLCGKDVGQPLSGYLAARCSAEVNYFYYLTVGPPEAITAQCEDGLSRGYTVFYLKVGVDAAAEEAMLAAARSALGPDKKIRIDANEAWSVPEASRLMTRWNDRFGIDFAEAPVRAFPHSLMQSLRQKTRSRCAPMRGLAAKPMSCEPSRQNSVDVLCFSSFGSELFAVSIHSRSLPTSMELASASIRMASWALPQRQRIRSC